MFSWKWKLSEIKQDKPYTVFSLFSCGGGSSMGYKRAGFTVLGNVEIDEKINDIYIKNLHPKFNFNMDVRDFIMLKNLSKELYQLDILDGSPPCTTFSMAGKREKAWGIEKSFAEGRKVQRLDDLFFSYLNVVEKLKPKICVAENVEGLVRGNAKGYVSEIIDRFHELGYDVQIFLLSSKFMDVPQDRRRVFFIANRMKFPKLVLDFHEKPIPFGQVRTPHGKQLGNGLYKRILMEMDGKPKSISDARKDGKTGGFNHVIVWDDQICPTIASNNLVFRACDKNYFSSQDIINVQTFPQDYDFKKCNVQYVCGMSVPPNMMAHIATQIWEQWLSK